MSTQTLSISQRRVVEDHLARRDVQEAIEAYGQRPYTHFLNRALKGQAGNAGELIANLRCPTRKARLQSMYTSDPIFEGMLESLLMKTEEGCHYIRIILMCILFKNPDAALRSFTTPGNAYHAWAGLFVWLQNFVVQNQATQLQWVQLLGNRQYNRRIRETTGGGAVPGIPAVFQADANFLAGLGGQFRVLLKVVGTDIVPAFNNDPQASLTKLQAELGWSMGTHGLAADIEELEDIFLREDGDGNNLESEDVIALLRANGQTSHDNMLRLRRNTCYANGLAILGRISQDEKNDLRRSLGQFGNADIQEVGDNLRDIRTTERQAARSKMWNSIPQEFRNDIHMLIGCAILVLLIWLLIWGAHKILVSGSAHAATSTRRTASSNPARTQTPSSAAPVTSRHPLASGPNRFSYRGQRFTATMASGSPMVLVESIRREGNNIRFQNPPQMVNIQGWTRPTMFLGVDNLVIVNTSYGTWITRTPPPGQSWEGRIWHRCTVRQGH